MSAVAPDLTQSYSSRWIPDYTSPPCMSVQTGQSSQH